MRTYVEREEKFDVDQDWSNPRARRHWCRTAAASSKGCEISTARTSTPWTRGLGCSESRCVAGLVGSETGWQLKVPHGTSRTELQSGSRSKSVPKALAAAAKGLLAGDSVAAVATVLTTRTTYSILSGDGQLVTEIADDAVQSVPADGESAGAQVEAGRG